MAIHAKSNGLLIGGKILEETEKGWLFQAMDNKRPNFVGKGDKRNKVFDGPGAVDEAIAWQVESFKKIGANNV